MDAKELKLFNRPALILIVLAIVIFNYFTMSQYAERFDWDGGEIFIIRKSLNNPVGFLIWILLIPLIIKLSNQFPYSRTNVPNILKHVLASIVLSMIVNACSWLLIDSVLYLFDSEFSSSYFRRYFNNFTLYFFDIDYMGVVIYWLVLIYLSSIEYYKKYRSETLRRSEAEKLITKAELQALKMQVQPHFLFNTLHSISSLVDENTEEAQEVIGRLGELLRYSLDYGKTDFVTLSTELKFIDNYLAIEKVRFKNRLNVSSEIEKQCENAQIPGFILQPLIENTIKHGLAKTNRKCHVRIIANRVENRLNLEIIDDGNGSESIVKGIGLQNIESRLSNYYENDFHFSYQYESPHGFKVTIMIPFTENSDWNE
ncbi:MAG: histidine kinase [Bacteroidota bacterium]